MKLLLFVCLLSVAHFAAAKINISPEMLEMISTLSTTCKEETGVDPALLQAAKKLDIKPDPKLKCFFKCMMTNMQLLSEEGEFDRDTAVSNIPDDIKALGAVEVVDKCKDEKGSDPCDTAYAMITCFAKHAGQVAELFT